MQNISPPQGFLAKRSTGLLVSLLCLVLFFGAVLYYTKARAEAVISNVTAYEVSSNYAAIKWITDVPGSTKVYYGIGNDYDRVNSELCDGGNLVTEHCAILSGLTPSTLYKYKVETVDLSSSISTKDGFSFTTEEPKDTIPPTAPGTPISTWSSPNQLNIFWNSSTDNIDIAGYKIYRDNVFVADTVTNYFYDADLSADIAYTYKIAAFDAANNLSSFSSILVARTLPLTGSAQGPVITSVQPENIALNSAHLKWNTDIVSNALVYYGTESGSYTLYSNNTSCGDTKYTTAHCVVIGSLTPGTKYYYRVESVNSSGGQTKSPEYTFTTLSKTVTPEKVAIATTTEKSTAVSFEVDIISRNCSEGGTYGAVNFLIDPSGAGYFSVGKLGQTLGSPFDSQTVRLPAGTYTWKAQSKKGYTPLTTGGNFVIEELSECASSPSSSSLKSKAEIRYDLSEVPSSELSYEKTVDIFREQVKKALSKGNKTIDDNIKAIKEIRQNSDLAPQSDTVKLGTETLSRTDAPAAVISAVGKTLGDRAVVDTKIDTDKDGISDYDETFVYGTDPKNEDSDGDKMTDGDEVFNGTDPVNKELVPVLYEDPQKVKVAYIAPTSVFSVEKAEPINAITSNTEQSTNVTGVKFQGKGPKNSFITIYFFSTPIVVIVKTDNDGKWIYTIDKELTNGEHKVYVAMTDSSGKILAKSSPLPFIKTAGAVSLGLSSDEGVAPAGFFSGNLVMLSLGGISAIVGISFLVLSLILKRKEHIDI